MRQVFPGKSPMANFFPQRAHVRVMSKSALALNCFSSKDVFPRTWNERPRRKCFLNFRTIYRLKPCALGLSGCARSPKTWLFGVRGAVRDVRVGEQAGRGIRGVCHGFIEAVRVPGRAGATAAHPYESPPRSAASTCAMAHTPKPLPPYRSMWSPLPLRAL